MNWTDETRSVAQANETTSYWISQNPDTGKTRAAMPNAYRLWHEERSGSREHTIIRVAMRVLKLGSR